MDAVDDEEKTEKVGAEKEGKKIRKRRETIVEEKKKEKEIEIKIF